jgi:hypothetical protein
VPCRLAPGGFRWRPFWAWAQSRPSMRTLREDLFERLSEGVSALLERRRRRDDRLHFLREESASRVNLGPLAMFTTVRGQIRTLRVALSRDIYLSERATGAICWQVFC